MVEISRVSIEEADPYLLFGLLGKQVIHPGGCKATEELLRFAELAPGQEVLDVGCGTATTAIEMARRGPAPSELDLAEGFACGPLPRFRRDLRPPAQR